MADEEEDWEVVNADDGMIVSVSDTDTDQRGIYDDISFLESVYWIKDASSEPVKSSWTNICYSYDQRLVVQRRRKSFRTRFRISLVVSTERVIPLVACDSVNASMSILRVLVDYVSLFRESSTRRTSQDAYDDIFRMSASAIPLSVLVEAVKSS